MQYYERSVIEPSQKLENTEEAITNLNNQVESHVPGIYEKKMLKKQEKNVQKMSRSLKESDSQQ